MSVPAPRRNTTACDLLVVGGGVIGLASAVAAAARGLRVTLFERAPGPAAESSGAAAGIISLLYPWEYPRSLQALAAHSRARYPDWCATLDDDAGWAEPGLLTFDPAPAGAGETLSDAELRRRVPGLTPPPGGRATRLAGAAVLEPPRLAAALARRAEALGVTLHFDAAVASLATGRGRVRGVVGADGATHRADRVRVAAGAWSAALLEPLGLSLPVAPVRGQVLELRGPPGLLDTVLLYRHRYLLPRADGRIVVGSTVERAGFDAAVTDDAAALLRATATGLLPATAGLPVTRHWAGLRPGSPDGVPWIGPVAAADGLWLNTGHFRNGITLAPGSAELLAALLAGDTPPLDPAPFARL